MFRRASLAARSSGTAPKSATISSIRILPGFGLADVRLYRAIKMWKASDAREPQRSTAPAAIDCYSARGLSVGLSAYRHRSSSWVAECTWLIGWSHDE